VLRGAFVGFGNVAANGHAPGWRARDDVKIVAATDAAASRRAAFLKAVPDGLWHETVEDLLAGEELDFMDICAPPGSHAALIERALAAGLHVLSEKPLVTRVEDAKPLAEAAARMGRVLHTVHNWLEAPICRRISDLINEGAIGEVRSVRWRTLRTQPAIAVSADGVANWRVDPALAGGGILFDHGWHALYCVMRWAGAPVSVAAKLETRRFHEHPLEDTASVDLTTAAGVSKVFLTWAADERSNTIEIDGEEVSAMDLRTRAQRIALVAQESELLFPLKVWEYVLQGRYPYGRRLRFETAEDCLMAGNALAQVGADALRDRWMDQLSGGEKQRVILARAMAQQPSLLLLDEPTQHLDIGGKVELLRRLRKLADENRYTVIVVTHELNLAAEFSDRIALLHKGKCLSIGSPDEVYQPEVLEQVFDAPLEVEMRSTGRPRVLLRGVRE